MESLLRGEERVQKAIRIPSSSRSSSTLRAINLLNEELFFETSQNLLKKITDSAVELLRAKVCSIMLLNESRATIKVIASHGLKAPHSRTSRMVDRCMAGQVVRTGKRLVLTKSSGSIRYPGLENAVLAA